MSGLAIRIAGLSASYDRRPILHGIDLAIEAGERVGIIGPNGAGKSSLLRCLTGGAAIEHRGAIEIDGLPLEDYPQAELARRIAVVPGQEMPPFAMRVEEVVALGRIPHEHPIRGMRPADRIAVLSAIHAVGIERLMGRNARELSQGERQLVALAMAVAQEGRLLILDEPTIHLDLRHQVATMELLGSLNRTNGTTVVAVLHDLALAAHFFPRLVMIQDGRVVADGPPETVVTSARIREVYGIDPRVLSPLSPLTD